MKSAPFFRENTITSTQNVGQMAADGMFLFLMMQTTAMLKPGHPSDKNLVVR